MKQGKQLSAVAAAVMMALASGGVHALGLGVPNTRAILGETLRMSVPLELEQGEDTDDGCPQAEVFYGESRLDAGKVILGVSPQSGRNRVITVRAIQPINEPLIDVTISYGCGARLSRKFTVFASPPEFVPTVVRRALARLADAGHVLISQSVLLRGVNADVATLSALMRAFVEARVKPYYLHHPDLAPGTSHFRLEFAEGQAIVEALRGRVSGLCQPTYVLDRPGGHGKAVLGPQAVQAADDGCYSVSDYRGGTHRYPPS